MPSKKLLDTDSLLAIKDYVDTADGNKVDKVSGKGLSTNDYTTTEKNKLAGIASGAEVNVQADWNVTDSTSDAYIKNKPSIPSAQVNSDWNASSGVAKILNKPTLGSAASKNTGTSSGNVPVLDSNGKLSSSVLPAIAITDTFVVNSQASMLALTAEVGDVCVRTDLKKSFILKTEGASTLSHWQELLTPTDAVTSVNGQTGAVTFGYLTSASKSGSTLTVYDSAGNSYSLTDTNTDTNTWRPLGTGANDACAGNDSRLSDARPANGGTSNAIAITGYGYSNFTYYQTDGTFQGNSGWAGYLISNHENGSSYYNQIIALPFWGSPKHGRKEGGTNTSWFDFITDENLVAKLADKSVNYATSAGSAGYATSAGSADSVAWSNVSGRPTFSFSNGVLTITTN